MRNFVALSVMLIVCLVLTGCGGGPRLVKVTGQLTYKQKPLGVGQGGVTVVFIPVVEGSQPHDTYPAVYEPENGTFQVPGKDGQGIPAGKYRISVQQMALAASAETVKMNEQFSAQDSPIVRDVTGTEPLNIDLAQFLGK